MVENNSTSTLTPNSTDGKYSDALIGCAFAIAGNLFISFSLNIQRFVHTRSDQPHYCFQPLWWVGLLLMILGELGNFSAYGLAPASMVAPLGTTTVIANMLIAVIVLKEHLRPEDLFGTIMAIIGSILIVSFSFRKDPILNAEELMLQISKIPFIVYVSLESLLLVALLVLHHVLHDNSAAVVLLIVSLIASYTVITAKGVSGMVQIMLSGESQLQYGILYVFLLILVVSSVAQVVYINRAMHHHTATVVVPVNFVFFSISAILSGVVFYGEFQALNGIQIFMFLIGCLFSFVGVYFIQLNRRPPPTEENLPHDVTPVESPSESSDLEDATFVEQHPLINNQPTATSGFSIYRIFQRLKSEAPPRQSVLMTE